MSRSDAFTRGPWSIETSFRGTPCIMAPDDLGRVGREGPRSLRGFWICGEVVNTDDPEAKAESEANARLISAAPDLLAACELALASLEVGGVFPLTVQPHLRAAVTKATGRTAVHVPPEAQT